MASEECSARIELQCRLKNLKLELQEVNDEILKFEKRRNVLSRQVRSVQEELKVLNENGEVAEKFNNDDFPWSASLTEKLSSVFRISEFRSFQKAAINATMSNLDVILVMPTGQLI